MVVFALAFASISGLIDGPNEVIDRGIASLKLKIAIITRPKLDNLSTKTSIIQLEIIVESTSCIVGLYTARSVVLVHVLADRRNDGEFEFRERSNRSDTFRPTKTTFYGCKNCIIV